MVAIVLAYFLITMDVPGAADLADELGQNCDLFIHYREHVHAKRQSTLG